MNTLQYFYSHYIITVKYFYSYFIILQNKITTEYINTYIMGSSQSSTASAATTVRKEIINENEINIIKKNTTENIMNSVVNSTSSCAAQATTSQSANVNVGNVTGVLMLGNTDQTQAVKFALSCIQVDSIQNDLANDISSSFMNQLSTQYDSATLDKIDANAVSAATSGFGAGLTSPFGSVESGTSNNTNYDFKQKTTNRKNLESIVHNVINKNFTTNEMKTCISTLKAEQNANVTTGDISGVAIRGDVKQDQTVEFKTKCIQENKSINKTIDTIKDLMNTVTADTTKITTGLDSKTTSSSTAKSSGPIDALGDLFGGIFGGIFGGLESITPLLIVLAVIAMFAFGYYMYKTNSSKDSSSD